MDSKKYQKTYLIKRSKGLHARVATQLAKIADNYPSQIYLRKNGIQADAKSVFQLLTLEAACGDKIELETFGKKAFEAFNSLEKSILELL